VIASEAAKHLRKTLTKGRRISDSRVPFFYYTSLLHVFVHTV